MQLHPGVRGVLGLVVVGLALAASGIVRAQPIINISGEPDDALELVLENFEKRLEAELGLLEWREALGPLDGAWEGSLEVIATTANIPAQFWQVGDRPELQIVIERDTAIVRVKMDDWQPVNVGGGFQAVDLKGGGFIYAGQSANGWIENWNLSVAKQDPDTLMVFLSFVAGRSLERLETGRAAFSVGAVGEFKRRTE